MAEKTLPRCHHCHCVVTIVIVLRKLKHFDVLQTQCTQKTSQLLIHMCRQTIIFFHVETKPRVSLLKSVKMQPGQKDEFFCVGVNHYLQGEFVN